MACGVITLDTSGLLAYIAAHDRYHADVMAVMENDRGPYIIPVGILAKMTFMIERGFPPAIERAFLADLRDGAYQLDWDRADLDRIAVLSERYADLALGFADAAVVACAERHGGRILTIDRRHFTVVARGEGKIAVLPLSD